MAVSVGFSLETGGERVAPARRRPITLGKKPRAVTAVESLSSKLLDAQTFHFITTLDAHQKLATLSSNRPRAKGNIRRIGCKIAGRPANGGIQGRNSTVKADKVTRARLTNSRALMQTSDSE